MSEQNGLVTVGLDKALEVPGVRFTKRALIFDAPIAEDDIPF